MAQDKLRVALVGANWGLTHVAAWRSLPDVELCAICTSRQETADKVAGSHGIPAAYASVERMMSEARLDVVDVTPRPSIRAPIAHQVLAHGKHLLQPLPFALNLSEGHTLRRVAQEAGLVAMVENLHRYSPSFRQAHDLIRQGVIGEVRTFAASVRTSILLDPPAGFAYYWLLDPQSGASALRNFGAHMLHVLEWFLGPARCVAARIATHLPLIQKADGSTAANGTSDSAVVLLTYDDDVDGTMDISWCRPGQNSFSLDFVGSRGRIVLECEGLGPRKAELYLTDKPHGVSRKLSIDPAYRQGSTVASQDDTLESLMFMCRAMADAIRSRKPNSVEPNFDDALRIMETVEAAYRASAERRWIDVAEFSAASRR